MSNKAIKLLDSDGGELSLDIQYITLDSSENSLFAIISNDISATESSVTNNSVDIGTRIPNIITDETLNINSSPVFLPAITSGISETIIPALRTTHNDNHGLTASTTQFSKADLIEAIKEAIKDIKVYVLESEITEAQNSVKTIIEKATF